MNVYDSHRMADTLAPEGYVETATPDDADLIILNTCHIREKAAEKVYSELGRMRELKEDAARDGRDVTIAVAGCVAQAEGEEIIRRAAARSISWSGRRAITGCRRCWRAPSSGKSRSTPNFRSRTSSTISRRRAAPRSRKRGVSAFVTVQEGCDKFCTFCVVPYTRGAEVSRPVAKIVAEAERLADAGVREITLIGQNVNAYHGEDTTAAPATLGRLLHRLAEIPGIARLRYTTSHPRDMDDESDRRASRSAGADAASASAGAVRLRPHSRGDEPPPHPRRLSRASSSGCARARPDIAFSSDFIVGFPGETEDDFHDTLRLVAEVGYASAYLVQIFAAARHARRRHGATARRP